MTVRKWQGNSPDPVIVCPDMVYIHANIEQVDENLWEADEVAYTLDEYKPISYAINEKNRKDIDDCNEALIELAEIIGG